MHKPKPSSIIYLLLICFFLGSMFIYNCTKKTGTEPDNNTNNPPPNPLIGTWELTLIKLRIDLSQFGYPNEMTPEEAGLGMIITANADSTFASQETGNGETKNRTGTWSTVGTTLTLTYDDTQETISGNYSITGNILDFDVTIPYEIIAGQTIDIPVTLEFTKQ